MTAEQLPLYPRPWVWHCPECTGKDRHAVDCPVLVRWLEGLAASRKRGNKPVG